MILYNVSVFVDEAIADEWLSWMKDRHIPDVMLTGCFTSYRIRRILDPVTSGRAGFNIQYAASTREDYERYRDEHAAALQADHTNRYAGRVEATRQLLDDAT